MPLADTRAAELAAIEKLHQEDIAATLSQDPNAHANLWTDDAVRLGWGRPAEVGKKAILAENEKFWAEHRGLKVLSYEPQIKDLQVAGEWAFEWGNFEATFKLSEEAPPVPYRGKVLRVLRRQSDASWKFARVCENPQNAPGQQ
ncbi:MAG: DUF4440 domain-containing protein [Acidobacteria bacterium]|nr:DUF4440 domain-containing protein [Acidobacteriota bacterium]